MVNQQHIPTIDELIALPELGDAQISPDGRFIVYTVNTPDWKENRYVAQLWLVATAGDTPPRQLTFARQSSRSPRWSADGQWLAFLSRRTGDEHTQIYRLSPFGGEAERLAELETDAQALAWSPDGQTIAYIAAEPESEADKKRQEMYGDYHVEDVDYRRNHLWALRLSDKKRLKLTAGETFHVVEMDWAPDSGRLAFQATPTPDMKDFDQGQIYTVDLATLTVRPLTPPGCETPRWSPDGRYIAFARFGTPVYYANNQLCLVSADGGEVQPIATSFDEIMMLVDYGPDNLYFGSLQRTDAHLFRLNPVTGDVGQLTPEQDEGWSSLGASFSADFTQAAVIVQDAAHYAEVAVLNLTDGTFRRLTNFSAKISEWPLPQPELFNWTSQDGTPIEGVLIKPADFDPQQTYPLLVVIHGGPTWTSLRLLIPSRRIYPIPQWTAKGAFILLPNYRGSAGYGEAFRALNVRNLGVGDYEDVISGVDALIARGWVDPERVGAMGWSQGGYISAFITTFSDRFKAVSVGAGIANWMTYYVNTDIHPFTRHYLGATPWDEMEIYQKTSPMTYIKQAKTPTLIQHGEQDKRVPTPNAYELYQGLQDMGVEARLVIYPGMGHGPNKPRQSRQIMQDNYDWFNRLIWGETADTGTKRPCYIALADGQQQDASGEVAAIERYTADAVQDVYHWARRDDADFRILSGTYDLLRPDDRIGPDPQPTLTAEAVSERAAQIATQLREQTWSKLVVYTGEVKKRPSALIALGCLQVAAGIVGDVVVEHHEMDAFNAAS